MFQGTFNNQLFLFCFTADCKDPGSPSNGARLGSNLNHGSQITFVCMEGFTLIGNSTTVCQEGNWSHALPKCKGNFIFMFIFVFLFYLFIHSFEMYWYTRSACSCCNHSDLPLLVVRYAVHYERKNSKSEIVQFQKEARPYSLIERCFSFRFFILDE